MMMRKVSVEARGFSTSLSLEPCFYEGLKAMAAANHVTVSELVGQFRDQRPRNLTSEIRQAVLIWYRDRP